MQVIIISRASTIDTPSPGSFLHISSHHTLPSYHPGTTCQRSISTLFKVLVTMEGIVWILFSAVMVAKMQVVTMETASVTINTCGGQCSEQGLAQRIAALEATVSEQQGTLARIAREEQSQTIRDCGDIFAHGNQTEGVYTIHPENFRPVHVYCQLQGDGMWTVIQRRNDDTLDFQRSWVEYKKGFGRLESNMWLGNDALHALTNQRQYRLRIELTDWEDTMHYAEYTYVRLDGEDKKYCLNYANYTGTAGDALGNYHNGMEFSTFDQDNDQKDDEHCAVLHGGGWWYRECDHANLNGRYSQEPILKGPTDAGIEWDSWRRLYSFKKTIMKIKRTFHP